MTTLVVLLTMAACLGAPGCRMVQRIKGWFHPADDIELTQAPAGEGVLDRRQAIKEAQFAPQSDRQGLEVRLMVVDDTMYDAPRLLNEILNQQQEADSVSGSAGDSAGGSGGDAAGETGTGIDQIDPETQRRWGEWGFRMVWVPVDRVGTLLDALTPVRPSSVQWLGEFGAWRAIVRAGEMRPTSVRVGDSLRRLDGGRPSLIARSWVEPMLGDPAAGGAVVGAAVRLDLGMQIQRDDRSGQRFFDPSREGSIEDSGMVIDPLLCSLKLSGRRALVIVGEAPGADWGQLPEPIMVDLTAPFGKKDGDGQGGDERDRTGPTAGPRADEDGGIGPRQDEEQRPPVEPDGAGARPPAASKPGPGSGEPQRPTILSLGELMLTTDGSRIVRLNETRVLPKRVIVVLVPYAPDRFQILPRARSASNGDAP